MSLREALLPAEPRDFPGRRISRSIIRTLHSLVGWVLIGNESGDGDSVGLVLGQALTKRNATASRSKT